MKEIPKGKCLVYRHVRLDKNEPFYVGIGTGRRPWCSYKRYRSKWWGRIVDKTEYRVDILFENVSKDFAIEKEMELIALYGRMDKGDGALCNMTDGGEGAFGRVLTEEHKEKIRQSLLGHEVSEETRRKIGKSGRGRRLTQKQIDNLVKINTGRIVSDDTKRKIGDAHRGKKVSKQARKKMSEAKLGGKSIHAVPVIDLFYGVFYDSMSDLADNLGVKRSFVSDQLRGRRSDTYNGRYKALD